MAREINRLSARTVATLKEPGRHSDGGGLYLVVDKSGAKRWAYLFRWEGKLKEMGLGGVISVPLAKARERAATAREQVADGVNPIAARRRKSADGVLFGVFAEELLSSLDSQWRNDKHRKQWRTSLQRHAPEIWSGPIASISTDDLLRALQPIWTSKAETASRVRARIERILDAATTKNLRAGDNPARWRGHLERLLPRPRKLARGHHTALPYPDLPAFLMRLRARTAISARALEFAILTAARSGETLGARWTEVDLTQRLWTVPAERMKAGRPHRVPLSTAAMQVLEPLAELRDGELVFPGQRQGRPLSVMAMEMILRRMEVAVTVHGFRSSFRDWAGEETDFAREIAEAALAHVVGDATERAYRRGDALERRRKLMDAWAAFCGPSVASDTAAEPASEDA